MRQLVPWWFRIAAKICLSRLPLSYGFWKRFRLFEHGDMEQPERALNTFMMHARSAGLLNESGSLPSLVGSGAGPLNVLELGPGDSLFSGLIAQALGATHTWLVDTGSYAVKNPASYKAMVAYLRSKGLPAADLSGCADFEGILKVGATTYATDGVRSLKNIPDASIDFCLSNAVLEHVDIQDFSLLAIELHRVLKPGGRACHRVDLKDHLGGGLNNLRFSKAIWEGRLFKLSGFYTNRIRYSEMTAIFREVGFSITCPRVVRWDRLPMSRNKFNSTFQHLVDEDLRVSGFDMVLKLDEGQA